MMSAYARRIMALEARYRAAGCATCQALPALVVVIDPAPAPPAVCPVCGRVASQIVRIGVRKDGPQ